MRAAALVGYARAQLDASAGELPQDHRGAAAADMPDPERDAPAPPVHLARRRERWAIAGRSAQARKHRRAVRAVPRLPGNVDVTVSHDVALSELERIDPEVARDEIDVRLRGERVLRLSRRARVPGGHLVRVHGRRLDARGRHAVPGEREHRVAGHERHHRLPRGIRAPVEDHAGGVRQDPALGVDTRP